MDILLTHGYFIAEDEHEKRIMKPYPPLGILSLSAYLKTRGYDVAVYDTTFSTKQDFYAYLNQMRPRIVGIYTNMMTKFNVLDMIRACKQIGAQVILGGPEPPYYAKEYLEQGADVIVIGEGELTLEELIPALTKNGAHNLQHIAGIHYRDEQGNMGQTMPRPYIKDLDTLPYPDRAAIDAQKYVDTWRTYHGRGSLSLISVRGCPFHCTWCSHSVYGESFRRRSPEKFANEAQHLVETYKPDQLWYADDVFTIHHGWLFKYANELKQRGIKMPFECISRADRMNEQVFDTLKEMGCYRLWIGSESGSQKILDAMRRDVQVERVQWATHELQKRGIEVGMFIMLGFDGEEESDIRATAEHLKISNPDIFLTTVAYPIKGTGYYKKVEEKILARTDWEHRTDRNLTVAGRHSKRYYDYAQQWLWGEFIFNKQRKNGNHPVRLAKAAANIGIGRLGMALTASQVER
jgi:anaerobic magnesium-protoporphyrin IX monomethyl ester cyclase